MIAVGGAFLALCIALVAGLVVYAALTLPDINTIGQATGTIRIVDVHGNLIAEVGHNNENRHTVSIDQIATIMQQATVAAEDRNFYNEGAFNPARVLKAMVDDIILRRPAEGASTITQQLAKQAFFGASAEKSPLRKVKEALLANELDSRYTKQQILDQYLNITYYGENAYGVESAALRYFGKHAKDLNLMEASLLAGLPEAPSYNDPYQNPSAAYARMHYVLSSLVTVGDVTQAAAQAVDPLVGGSSPSPAQQAEQQHNQAALHADLQNGQSTTGVGPAPHFVQYIQDQLQSIFGQNNPEYLQGSLVVTTTLDLNIQNLATSAVQKGVAKLSSDGANNGALLMIDARTGAIEAMVGSASFSNNAIAGQYNVVTASRRPGSSFKPYVYEAGFLNGTLKPSTILQDTRGESQKLGGVQDYDRRFLGPITAARALLLSRNVATEQAMQMAGVQPVLDLAYSMGINRSLTPLAANLSTAIGSSAVRMIDHTSAFAAFANAGQKVQAHGILKITDDSGNVIRDYSVAPNLGRVLTPAQAWSITSILRNYPKQWNLQFKYPTAGKSGTTDNFVDAWYMAYTPDWVVATWAGHTSASQAEQGMNQVFGTATGAAIAVPFVNSLPRPSAFTPVAGALSDCASADAGLSDVSGCPTPTPQPTPVPTPVPTAPPPTSTPPVVTLPPTLAPTPTPLPLPGGTPAAASTAPTAAAAPTSANQSEPTGIAERRIGY